MGGPRGRLKPAPGVLVHNKERAGMAIKQKGVVKTLRVASMNPDNFVSGGLMDDFDGVITKARFAPWDYDGKIDHHVLAVAVSITPKRSPANMRACSASAL